jgi:hypothetical protein
MVKDRYISKIIWFFKINTRVINVNNLILLFKYYMRENQESNNSEVLCSRGMPKLTQHMASRKTREKNGRPTTSSFHELSKWMIIIICFVLDHSCMQRMQPACPLIFFFISKIKYSNFLLKPLISFKLEVPMLHCKH